MRRLALIILLLSSTISFAETTIHTVIKENSFIATSWWEKAMRLNNDFPQKQYISQGIPFKNPYYMELDNSANINVRNARLILLTFKLKLINYDSATNFYQFNLSVAEVGLQKNTKYKVIPAEVYFDNIKSKEIVLKGKFVPILKGNVRPKLDHRSDTDIALSVDIIKDIIISAQHNIPITINLHD